MTNPLQPLLDRVRVDVSAVKNAAGVQAWTREPLTPARIAAHLGSGPSRGVCPIKAGESTTQVALFDLDSHKGATSWRAMCVVAARIMDALGALGLTATPFASSGGQGIHLYVLWDAPQGAYSVRHAMAGVLTACGIKSGTRGVEYGEVEIFPKQNAVPLGGFGNQFILPLAGGSVPLAPMLGLAKTPRDCPFVWAINDRRMPVLDEPPTAAPSTVSVVGHEVLQAALDAIPNTGVDELDYDTWRNVMFALHHATQGDDDGLQLAHQFSAKSSKYDPAFLDGRVWPYITPKESGVTVGTLFHVAARYGFDNPTYAAPSSDDFDDISQETTEGDPKAPRFVFQQAAEFVSGPPPEWIVKDLLPKAELAVVYGESGSGKTFWVLDLVMAIARGVPWRDTKTTPGTVAYIAAEGAGGFKSRIKAYAQQHLGEGEPLSLVPLHVLGDSPSFIEDRSMNDLRAATKSLGKLSVIVVDTYASVMPGGNENSGEDAGKVVHRCKVLHRETGALVILIHHSGKDTSKGARGWSGLRAAADAEIEITRAGTLRTATITKLKDGDDVDKNFGFELTTVTLEQEGHDPVTSCYVGHNGTSTGDVQEANIKKRKGDGTPSLKHVIRAGAQEILGLAGSLPEMTFFDDLEKETKLTLEEVRRGVDLMEKAGEIIRGGGRFSWPAPLD